MAWMDQDSHTVILDTFYRYATVLSVDSEYDTADVEILDADGQPTGEIFQDVPLFYHCSPDVQQRSNGALYGAAQAFAVGDTAVVKFEAAIPVIIGRREGLRACGAQAFVLSGSSIFMGKTEGTPEDGTFRIKDLQDTGLQGLDFCLHDGRWFVVSADHKIRSGPWGQTTADLIMAGSWGDIHAVTVRGSAGAYEMFCEERQGTDFWEAVITKYTSMDMINWTYAGTVKDDSVCINNRLESGDYSPPGAGYWEALDRCAVLVEPQRKPEYPNPTVRIYRCGRPTLWDSGGQKRPYEFFTAYSAGYGFTYEGTFEVVGLSPSENVQILQIL